MSGLRQKLGHELKVVGATTAFFAGWFGSMMLFKRIVLEDYNIEIGGFSAALVGALIVAKVVLVLENVRFGSWLGRRPAWVHVMMRTSLYAVGVALVLLVEKGFDGRHEYGGFFAALVRVFEQRDVHHVWATTLCVSGALLIFNALSVVRAHLANRSLMRLFLIPVPEGAGSES